MKYLKVEWFHNISDEPVLIYSELNDYRWEKRKAEFFHDGKIVVADNNRQSGLTRLSIEPIPTIEEIGSDKAFIPHEISKDEFETVWLKGTLSEHQISLYK